MNKRKKKVRWFAYVLGALVIVVTLAAVGFGLFFNSILKDRLEEKVGKETNGKYILTMRKLSINLFSRSVRIHDFLIQPGEGADSTTANYLFASDKLNLLNLNLTAYLFRDKLIFSKLELINPRGVLYRGTRKSVLEVAKQDKPFSAYDLISEQWDALKISEISVINAEMKIYSSRMDTVAEFSSTNNALLISNLVINKSAKDSGKVFLADQLDLIVNEFSYTNISELYSIRVKRLTTSYFDASLVLDSVELKPNYNKKDFAHEAGKQIDRFAIAAGSVRFSELDVKSFFEEGRFIAKLLELDHLNISAYRDKNVKRKPEVASPLQQVMKSIPFYTAIDTIRLKNTNIKYEEVASGTTRTGMISFDGVEAVIGGFTSDSMLFSKYDKMTVEASGLFMNKGKLKARFVFPLNTDNMVFDCSGTLSDLPMTSINKILEPAENISIREGTVRTMAFNFHAGEKFSTGTMRFIYNDLKIEFLNKDRSKTGFKEDVYSFLANRLIIKESNPTRNAPVRETAINYRRNPERFIFNYSWKSILSGVKPAIGLPE